MSLFSLFLFSSCTGTHFLSTAVRWRAPPLAPSRRASFHSAIVNYQARRVCLPSRRRGGTAITRDGEQLPFVRRLVTFHLCLSAVYLCLVFLVISRGISLWRGLSPGFSVACLSILGLFQRTPTRAFSASRKFRSLIPRACLRRKGTWRSRLLCPRLLSLFLAVGSIARTCRGFFSIDDRASFLSLSARFSLTRKRKEISRRKYIKLLDRAT